MSENGSSSMGSICGSTLAMMNAGIPIKKPVAGIAIGLILNEKDPDDFKVLTDIRDLEDFYGFMDFKVAGTSDGVTAVQMDGKASSIKVAVLEQAFKQAKAGRDQILEVIKKTISKPNEDLSKYAPKVEIVKNPS